MGGPQAKALKKATGSRDPIGPAGERAAGRMLRRAGYKIIGRNVNVPVGEADLVCLAPDRETHVIVEVKTRRTSPGRESPPPEANVHAAKQKKLVAIARWLMKANQWDAHNVRIDVVAVEWPARKPVLGGRIFGPRPKLRHHIDIVRDTH